MSDKQREALLSVKQYFTGQPIQPESTEDKIMELIDSALEEKPNSIETFIVEGLIRQAYDKGLSRHLTNLTVELYHLPEDIKKQAVIIFENQQAIDGLKNLTDKIKNVHLQPILANKDLGNQTKRDIALEESLQGDPHYIGKTEELQKEFQKLRTNQIEYDFLLNKFSSYKTIARLQEARAYNHYKELF